jgi:hypothetical protein
MKKLETVSYILGLLLLFQACSESPITPQQAAQLSETASNSMLAKGKPQPPEQPFPSLPNGGAIHIAGSALSNQQSPSILKLWSYSPGVLTPVWTGQWAGGDGEANYFGIGLGSFTQKSYKELAGLVIYTPTGKKQPRVSYLEIYSNSASSPATYPLSYVPGTTNGAFSLDVRDLDGDGYDEVLVAGRQSFQIWGWSGSGMTMLSELNFANPNVWCASTRFGDPDGDGATKVVIAAYDQGLLICRPAGGYSFQQPDALPAPSGVSFVDARVLDFGTGGSKHPVIACCGFNHALYFYEYSNNTFTSVGSFNGLAGYPMATAAGDFDSDGKVEIAVGMANPGQTSIYEVTSDGSSFSLDNPVLLHTSYIDDMCSLNYTQPELAASGQSLYVYNGSALQSDYVGQEIIHIAVR